MREYSETIVLSPVDNRSSLFYGIEEKRGVAPTSAPSLDAENIFGDGFGCGKILGELLKHIKVDDMAGETAKNILGVSQKHIFFCHPERQRNSGEGSVRAETESRSASDAGIS